MDPTERPSETGSSLEERGTNRSLDGGAVALGVFGGRGGETESGKVAKTMSA